MIKSLKIIIYFLVLIVFLFPGTSSARTNITDWYIRDFKSEIVVNKDASLIITEIIMADCGNLSNKHGIFRVLPEYYVPEKGSKIYTPIELVSITDGQGKSLKYSTTNSSDIITWKIGDPNKTVNGVNTYVIRYRVENTIRFENEKFDEFYWNLNGNFWDIETDNFQADIIFPTEINQKNIETYLYSGASGMKNAGLAESEWIKDNTLRVRSTKKLSVKEGITASVTFPKNIATKPLNVQKPNRISSANQSGPLVPSYISNIIALAMLLFSYYFAHSRWLQHSEAKYPKKTIIAEYDIPNNLSPMELGSFLANKILSTSHISAAIVDLAVKGFITIEDIPKKGFFSQRDTRLTRTDKGLIGLEESALVLIDKLFASSNTILMSSLRNKFYKDIPAIKIKVSEKLNKENLFSDKAMEWRTYFIIIAIALVFISFILAPLLSSFLVFVSGFLSVLIFFRFAFLIKTKTAKGEDLLWRTKGFKLYMETAEKYRQQFYEKENIFERLLPYAMIFGMTGLWIKKMKEIYGEEFNDYRPMWYVGSMAAFDIDSFASRLTEMTSSMSATMASNPSSSGSGGGGSSGGGGGGGGGGGW